MFEKVYKNVNKEVYKESYMEVSFTLLLSQCSNNIILH